MDQEFGMKDLETRMEEMVSQPKTTVILDRNVLSPPFLTPIEGLNLKQIKARILNGVDIFNDIRKQGLLKQEIGPSISVIRGCNKTYIHILYEVLTGYPNVVVPLDVKREVDMWIYNTQIEEWEKGISGEKASFMWSGKNDLKRMNQSNPYFVMSFNAMHEYVKDLRQLLEDIPRDQIIANDAEEKDKLVGELKQATANKEDKYIFADGVLTTNDMGNNKLAAVSFDSGFRGIAADFKQHKVWSRLGLKKIEPQCYRGYSLAIDKGRKNLIVLRYDRFFPRKSG